MAAAESPCRNLPGTKAAEFCQWPFRDLATVETPLALQQHLQWQIRHDPSDMVAILTLPKGQDDNVWKYEHLRQFALQLSVVVAKLQEVCTEESCPRMKCTDEWEYLCAAHRRPEQCCAIDYIIHTLKQTSDTLNDRELFRSRVSVPRGSVKTFPPMARRLYRIFAHCYFHHEELFYEIEEETHLCERFTKFVTVNKLVSRKLQIIPNKFRSR